MASIGKDFVVRIVQQPFKGQVPSEDSDGFFYPGLVVAVEYPKIQPIEVLEKLHLICSVSICEEDYVDTAALVHRYTGGLHPALTGNRVSTGSILKNPHYPGHGFFFVFPDISCPIEGSYRLKCNVVDMSE